VVSEAVFFLYTRDLSDELYDALYEEAERLGCVWHNADLAIDFADRMIDAVIRFLLRNGIDCDPQYARRLLVAFWAKNAKRDFARAKFRSKLVPLEQVQIGAAPYFTKDEYELFSRCRKALVGSGMRPEIAEAFLQDTCHGKPDDVIRAVEVETGHKISAMTLRQWRKRHFKHAARYLRGCPELGLEAA